MSHPIYTTENPIVCATTAIRDGLLSNADYKVAGLPVQVGAQLYFLNADLATWSESTLDVGRTRSDVAHSSDSSTSVLPVVLTGLAPSSIYLLTLGCRVYLYKDADHSVGGAVDLVIGVSATTDSSGVATCTLSGTPAPDVSNLPAGLAGATATVAASTGGFTISATRPSGVACHSRAKWFTDSVEKVS